MKKMVVCTLVFLTLNACVTKSKYEDLLKDIASKEKQQLKLNKQLAEQKGRYELLRDSANNLGGGL